MSTLRLPARMWPSLDASPIPAQAPWSVRAEALFHEHLQAVYHRRDRVFAWLMTAQWIFAIGLALVVSPKTWEGGTHTVHVHVYAALLLGAVLNLPVFLLVRLHPGAALTRHVIAASQMLWSALLIHISGGRIETHFHVFGSLAFLAFYRDWTVIVTGTIAVAADHYLRGVFWPQSVYGIANPEWWRFLEHAGWVAFEDVVLVMGIHEQLREMRTLAARQAELESLNGRIEQKVVERTAALEAAEREARASESYARAIIDNAGEGIITADADGRVTELNAAAEAIFARERKDVVGSLLATLFADGTTFEAAQLSRRAEAEARREDGRTTPVEILVTPVRSAARSFAVCLVRDLTDAKELERDRQRIESQRLEISRQAGMALVATNVLHNVGNVLNSVNVSATLTSEHLRAMTPAGVQRSGQLLEKVAAGLPPGQTPQVGKVASYLTELGTHLETERDEAVNELRLLTENIDHIKAIVSMQQSLARPVAIVEEVSLSALVRDAVRLFRSSLDKHGVSIVYSFEELPPLRTERHRVLEILINLLSNARDAVKDCPADLPHRIEVRIARRADGATVCEVVDTGVGISEENASRIFSSGFTTKVDGHGFGLHASALAASRLNGSLTCRSDGAGKGATFTLVLTDMKPMDPALHERAAA